MKINTCVGAIRAFSLVTGAMVLAGLRPTIGAAADPIAFTDYGSGHRG
jgi:hypothetical protein